MIPYHELASNKSDTKRAGVTLQRAGVFFAIRGWSHDDADSPAVLYRNLWLFVQRTLSECFLSSVVMQ